MKTNLTLNQAIADYFDIDGRTIPAFDGGKPVAQARDWLTSEKHGFEYIKRDVPQSGGLVIYTRGGVPIYGVLGKGESLPAGSMLLGSFVKKMKKTPKTSKNDENSQNDDDSELNNE